MKKTLPSKILMKLQRSFNRTFYGQPRIIECQFPFEKEFKCIFIHIPKTAGCSVTKGLFNKPDGLGHLKIGYYKENLKRSLFEQYFKFSFVRNPWDRVLSAYTYLKRGGCGNEVDLADMEKYIKGCDIFESFVLSLKNNEKAQNLLSESVHFQPQYKYICDDRKKILVDFVGKTENIEKDFQYIAKKLNIKAELAHENKSNHNHYLDVYNSQEMIDIIHQLYFEDIQLFNYAVN